MKKDKLKQLQEEGWLPQAQEQGQANQGQYLCSDNLSSFGSKNILDFKVSCSERTRSARKSYRMCSFS